MLQNIQLCLLLFHYILRWVFMEKMLFFLLPKQMCHLSMGEQQQASTAQCISSNESLFNKGTSLVSYSPFPDPCLKLSKTHIYTMDTKEWSRMGTSCQVMVPQPSQLTRQQQPDGIARIVSFCYKVAMGWHNILPLDCFQSCLSPMASPCNYPHSRRPTDKPLPCKQNAACRPHQLPNHTHSVRFGEL